MNSFRCHMIYQSIDERRIYVVERQISSTHTCINRSALTGISQSRAKKMDKREGINFAFLNVVVLVVNIANDSSVQITCQRS